MTSRLARTLAFRLLPSLSLSWVTSVTSGYPLMWLASMKDNSLKTLLSFQSRLLILARLSSFHHSKALSWEEHSPKFWASYRSVRRSRSSQPSASCASRTQVLRSGQHRKTARAWLVERTCTCPCVESATHASLRLIKRICIRETLAKSQLRSKTNSRTPIILSSVKSRQWLLLWQAPNLQTLLIKKNQKERPLAPRWPQLRRLTRQRPRAFPAQKTHLTERRQRVNSASTTREALLLRQNNQSQPFSRGRALIDQRSASNATVTPSLALMSEKPSPASTNEKWLGAGARHAQSDSTVELKF